MARYHEIADHYRALIKSGEIAIGSKMPTQAAIRSATRGAPSTVSRAMQLLEAEGLIESKRGSGSIVIKQQTETFWPLTGRYARARAARNLLFAEIGDVRKESIDRAWLLPPSEIGELLRIEDEPVLRRRSRTYVDDVPVEETSMFFPRAVVDRVPAFDEPADILVAAMLEDAGYHIDRTDNRLRARPATRTEADILRLSTGAPIFEHTHGTYSADDEPLEAVINVKPADGAVLTFETFEGELNYPEDQPQ